MVPAVSPKSSDPADSPVSSPSKPGRLGLLLSSYYADSSSADSSGDSRDRSVSVDSVLPSNEVDYDSQGVSELTRAYAKLSRGSAELQSDLRMLLYENCTKFLGAAKAVEEVSRTTGDILDETNGDLRVAERAIKQAADVAIQAKKSNGCSSVRKLVDTMTDLDRVQQLEALRRLPDTLAAQTDDLTLVAGYKANCEQTLNTLGKELRTVHDLEEKCLEIVNAADGRLRHRIKADFDLTTVDRLAMTKAVYDVSSASQEFRTIECMKLREMLKQVAPKQVATMYMPRYVEVRDALYELDVLEESFCQAVLSPALKRVAESSDMDAITGLLSFASNHHAIDERWRSFARTAAGKWTAARLAEAREECVKVHSERPLVLVCGTLSTGAAELLDSYGEMSAEELGSLMLDEVCNLFEEESIPTWRSADDELETIALIAKIIKQSVVDRLSISVCAGLDKTKPEAAVTGLLDHLCDAYATKRGVEIAHLEDSEDRARQLAHVSKSLDETLAGLDSIQPMRVLGKVYEAFLDTLSSSTTPDGVGMQQEITKLVTAAESVLASDEALAVAAMVQDHS